MQPVEEGGVDQLVGQRLEQVAVARVGLVAFHVQVAGEDQAGVGGEALGAAAELAALHVVLERGDGGVLVAERGVGDLVEDHDLARAEDADRLVARLTNRLAGVVLPPEMVKTRGETLRSRNVLPVCRGPELDRG